MRNPDYEFIPVSANKLMQTIASSYENETGHTLRPGSPDYQFVAWVVNIVIQLMTSMNYIGNQNIPSRATGDNLDALAELFYMKARPAATYATCVVRFEISEPQETAVLVEAGTQVTDAESSIFFATLQDAYISPGNKYIDLPVQCTTIGTVGNGYVEGSLNNLVDIFDYYERCSNLTASAGGSEKATDEEFYEMLRTSQDAYSSSGPRGAYIYHAKSVSSDIADVIPVTSESCPGEVHLYVLMADGSIAGQEIKDAVLKACSSETVRPLTDYVSVIDPSEITFDIDVTYYLSRRSSKSLLEIQSAVSQAINKFTLWQTTKLGRDINPSYLIKLLMETGIKRCDVRTPVFRSLNDGSLGAAPEVGKVGMVSIVNGGYEDD